MSNDQPNMIIYRTADGKSLLGLTSTSLTWDSPHGKGA